MSNNQEGFGKPGAGGARIYLTPMGDKLVQKVSADTPGSVSRVNKEGNTVHELLYPSFTGRITGVFFVEERDPEKQKVYGDQLIINMIGAGTAISIKTRQDGGFGMDFLARFCNEMVIKYKDVFTISCWNPTNDKGKKRSFLLINQGEGTIKSPFQRDEVPQWVEIKDSRGNVFGYDRAPAVDFLKEKVLAICKKHGINTDMKSPAVNNPPAGAAAVDFTNSSASSFRASTSGAPASQEDIDDDLPF
jgi:hypothetical protein